MKPVIQILTDLRAAVSVAFVAIPLALGVALASGVPPAAGLFTCMAGGLLLGLFGGGYVSIGGTSKMLIGVIGAAMLSWGGDEQAYRYLLAAVVVAGLIQFALGWFKLGDLGDFFPATAIQAMLASIGLIILAKQLHVAFGVETDAHGIWELLISTPGFLLEANPVIFLLAAVGLLIQYGHSRWTWWGIQTIPSVMWVVILGWAFSHFTGVTEGWEYRLFGKTYSVGPEHLVSLPETLAEGVFFPDFSLWEDLAFWTTALTIVMVGGIESVISSKAIDKLDPKKRRTNLNRELRAVGLASGLAGSVGGIPVVAEVVRSAANVYNGGRTRLANFLHAAMIFLLTWFGMDELQKIPKALLASILIYAAYKLIKPKVFKGVWELGKGEFAVFMITLLAIVSFNLLIGLALGIAGAVVIILRSSGWEEFLRYWRKPNVLLQMESAGKYHLSIKGFAVFTNYLNIKRRLDRVPRNSELILDFSLCSYLDHSVQDHLEQLEDNFRNKGGEVKWVGLNRLQSMGIHPKAARTSEPGPYRKRFLTERQQELYTLSVQEGLTFEAEPRWRPYDYRRFPFFSMRTPDQAFNRMSGSSGKVKWEVLDLFFHQGEFFTKENLRLTCARIRLNGNVPHFVMTKEQLLDKLVILAGWHDLNFEGFPSFSSRYWVKAREGEGLRLFLRPELLSFLEAEPVHHIESNGHDLLVFYRERLATREEFAGLVSFVARFAELLNTSFQPDARPETSH